VPDLHLFYIRFSFYSKDPSPATDGYLAHYMTADEISSKNLVLDRVTKYYGQFRAVDQ